MKKTLFRIVLSLVVTLSFSGIAQTIKTLTPLSTFGTRADGSLQPGDVSFVTSGAAQRGVAYNPATGNIIFVDREADGSGSASVSGKIYVLNGNTAEVVATLSTNGIAGGNYADYAVQVDDSGVIYVGNLVNNGTLLLYNLYRWDSENSTNSDAPPLLVYSGDPGTGKAQRWGATMDLRGSGTTTQFILGSQTQGANQGTNVAILTTIDGTNFTATTLNTDMQENNSAFGIAFGTGDTFWTKHTSGKPFRQLSFDLGTATATTLRNLGSSSLPAIESLGPIAVDVANNLLATMEITSGANVDNVRLYDISNPNAPLLLDIKSFPVDGGNVSASGGFLDFGGGKLYAHSINSGLLVFSIDSLAATAPVLLTQPKPLRKSPGQNASFDVLAYPAATYQWVKNGSPISGATNPVLTLVNVQTNDAGDYSVVVSNSADTVTSSTAALSVLDPSSLFRLAPLWSIAPGARSYVNGGGAGTPNQRQMGYSAISNEVYIVSRGGPSSSVFTLAILNATNGVEKGFLKTTGVIGGNIGLVGIDVSPDGSIYMANMVAPAAAGTPLKIYRWANSNTNTDPVVVFSGVPDTSVPGSPTGTRWGDNLAVRGSGVSTEILLDNFESTTVAAKYVVVLRPTDAELTNFVATGNVRVDAANLKIGRSLQWGASGNEYWTKKASNRLELLTFDFDSGISGGPIRYTNFPVSLGPVALDFTNKLLAGINSAASITSPQQLVLYEVSDLNAPLLLDTKLFPANKASNNNGIGNVIFGEDIVFALDGNNGVVAFRIETGPPVPPVISQQPASMRLVSGGMGTLSVTAPDTATFQWRFNGTNIVGATSPSYTINNAQLSNVGTYSVVLSNAFGGTLSSNATVTVTSADETYQLAQIWNIAPGTRDYITTDPSNTPNQRSLAYNSLSNQVLMVSRTNATSGQRIVVLDPATGNFLHELDTSSITPVIGQNIIMLMIGIADDGAVYSANASVTSGTANPAVYSLYRWENSASNTIPTLVFSAEPANQTNVLRWGDSMDVRGSGINTEVIIDEGNNGDLAAVLKPTDASMTAFTNIPFVQHYGKGSIGRSLQFASGNTIWQKRHATAGVSVTPLVLTSYDLTNGTSVVITNYPSFPTSAGAMEIDSTRNLATALNFSSTPSSPDTLALYEISDLNLPMLIAQYPFPTNQQPNANFIGQSVFAGNRVFAINGNNGIVAFDLIGPAGAELSVTHVGTDVQLSWPDGSFILQSATNLTPTILWTDISSVGQTSAVENASSGTKFYRLKK